LKKLKPLTLYYFLSNTELKNAAEDDLENLQKFVKGNDKKVNEIIVGRVN
jgi:hypothetical protein